MSSDFINKKSVAIYVDFFINGVLPYGGGAEIYSLYLAKILSKKFNVTIFSNKATNPKINLRDLFVYYNLELKDKSIKFEYADSISWEAGRLKREHALYKKFSKIINNKYDLFFNVSDNTLYGFADKKTKTKSIKIIHYPKAFSDSFLNSFFNNIYKWKFLKSYDLLLANSEFTKSSTSKLHGFSPYVLFPPVNTTPITNENFAKKENIIICAGRVVPDKKILELAQCFKKFYESNKSWKFVVVGNTNPCDKDYFEKIRNVLKNTQYELNFDVPDKEYNLYLEKAKILWAAKGLDTDEGLWIEQFGMSVVEGMAKGCVPVVINKGGHKETVDEKCGYLWNSLDELIKFSNDLSSDNKLIEKLGKNAISKSKQFLIGKFEDKINSYIEKLNI